MDCAHWFGNDLSVSATGDILMVDGTPRGQQRVLRRLLTNPQDYIWHLEYGAGLGLYVGQTTDPDIITAIERQQVMQEAAVAPSPDPVVTTVPIPLGIQSRIAYTDADTGIPVTLSFDVNQ